MGDTLSDQPIELWPTNRDPDGFACYSDHDHDISTKGDCDWCGSTEHGVVGHVLPSVERFTGKDPVAAAAIVLHTKSLKFFDGVLLDYQTAGAIYAVYDALSIPARERLRGMSLAQAGTVCWKLATINTRRT